MRVVQCKNFGKNTEGNKEREMKESDFFEYSKHV